MKISFSYPKPLNTKNYILLDLLCILYFMTFKLEYYQSRQLV